MSMKVRENNKPGDLRTQALYLRISRISVQRKQFVRFVLSPSYLVPFEKQRFPAVYNDKQANLQLLFPLSPY
jgi:hypothetical protein